MAARTIAGVVVTAIGVLIVAYSGFNFQSLFFVSQLTRENDVPIYAQLVALPFLIGLLILIDGFLILGLKRPLSFSVHVIANVVWLYATITLYQLLLVPVRIIGQYQQVFVAFFIAMIFFVAGVIVNDVASRRFQPGPQQPF